MAKKIQDTVALRRRVEAEENAVIDAQFAILDLLFEAGINKTELARRLDISKSAVSQLFAAGANPTLKQIARIFDALDSKFELKALDAHQVRSRSASKESDEIRLPDTLLREALSEESIRWRRPVFAANENYAYQREAA